MESRRRASPPTSLVALAFAFAVLSWWVAWLYFGRNYLFDDALIHLNYARNLWQGGALTFDGSAPTYGTSSPLYVFALTPLVALFDSPVLPKLASVMGAGLVQLFALARGRRDWRWVGAAILAFSPMSLRWLVNGMETAWAVAAAGALGLWGGRVFWGGDTSRKRGFALAWVAFAAVLLRVELIAAVAAASAAVLLVRRDIKSSAIMVAGAALGALGLFVAFGSVLSDAAVAKGNGLGAAPETLELLVRAHVVSGSLGAGTAVLWLASLLAVRSRLRPREALGQGLLVINALVPAVLVLAVLRGQSTPSIRYFLPFYVFAFAWNTYGAVPPLPRWWRSAAMSVLVVWAIETHQVVRLVESQSAALLRMQAAHLERFSGHVGLAFDVGFIGYYTRARICDGFGLVNGRQAALTDLATRLRDCAAREPKFAFLTAGQHHYVRRYLALDSWVDCPRMELLNATGGVTHRLYVAPELAASCTEM